MSFIKKILIIIFLIIIFIYGIIDYFILNFLFQDDQIQNIFLLGAFLAAFYYAFVTHKIWQLEQKPVLRLQWNDLGRVRYFRELKEIGKDNENINKYYNTFTDLELINDGKGSAWGITLDVEYLCNAEDIPRLRNVTQIGPRGFTQLRYRGLVDNNRYKIFNNEMEAYKKPFKIIVIYKDVEGVEKKCSFIVDEKYNDGFRIDKK